jgi:adenylate cyclase
MAIVFISPLGQRLEREFGLGALYALRGTLEAPGEALVIGLDRASVGWLQRNIRDIDVIAPPLAKCLTSRAKEEIAEARNVNHIPRGLHACLLGDVLAQQPRLIIFDISFNVERPEDADFGRAIRDAGNVILLEKIIRGAPETRPGTSAMVVRLRPVALLREAALGAVGFQVDGTGSDVTTGYVRRFAEFPDLQVMPVAAWMRYVRSDRPAVRADAGVQEIWLYGPPGTIPTWSIRDIFDRKSGHQLPDTLRDIVVFVGASDPVRGTSDDHFKIPTISGGHNLISGVELAATAFLNLLHGETLSSLSILAGAALLFSYAFASGAAALLLTSSRGLIFIIGLAVAYATLSAIMFAEGRIWLPVVTPVILTAPVAVLMALETRHRFARTLVMRLAPRQFARIMLDDPAADRDAPQIEQATTMFTDIVGSVALAERMGALDFAELMTDYYNSATAVIEANDGMVIDYRSDGIVAIFTESVAGQNHAARACLAALAICSRNARGSAENAPAHREQLKLRIGLNSGTAVVGLIGARDRSNVDALGDSVDVAARLEQLGKKIDRDGRDVILVGDATRVDSALSDDYFEPLGRVRLRGREAETSIYRLQEPHKLR